MIKKIGITLLLVASAHLSAQAQSILGIGIGASYEIRNEEPRTGFGFRFEKNVFNLAVVNIRSRINYSMFSEEFKVSAGGVSVSQKSEGFDLSGAVTAGVGLGLFGPYIGVGGGFEQITSESPLISDDGKTVNSFTYGLLGVAITPVPFVKPFVEYRYNSFITSKEEAIQQAASRFIIGVTVRI